MGRSAAEMELAEDWLVYGITRALVVAPIVLVAEQGCWSYLCDTILVVDAVAGFCLHIT